MPDLVVAQQDAKGLSPRMAKLGLVDFAEQLALVELEGPRLVLDQFIPRDVQNADLDGIVVGQFSGQVLKPAPGRVQLLKAGVMEDGVELSGH